MDRRVHDRILLTGPNGTGKSTILHAMAHLWLMVGQWLATPDLKPKNRNRSRAWLLDHTKAVALIVGSIPGMNGKIGLYFGASEQFVRLEPEANFWMGETTSRENPERSRLVHPHASAWMQSWSKAYTVLRLGSIEPSDEHGFRTPNMVYLEAEERKWVRPKGNPVQLIPDDSTQRWLVTYRPNENWQGQLEMSLLNLKTLDERRYLNVLQDLNRFLVGKSIRSQPTPGLRLLVDLEKGIGARTHNIDELSAGERQVLIQLYLISRWLQPGGLVLLDEPDIFLHPSLIQMLLGQMEAIVADRGGQVILTTHLPDLWRSYETKALRVELGGPL